jgi:hypothetical protein
MRLDDWLTPKLVIRALSTRRGRWVKWSLISRLSYVISDLSSLVCHPSLVSSPHLSSLLDNQWDRGQFPTTTMGEQIDSPVAMMSFEGNYDEKSVSSEPNTPPQVPLICSTVQL